MMGNPTPPLAHPKRILVIETLYLGDLVHTLPLINALRSSFPQAEIDALVRAPQCALMRQAVAIDEVLGMDPQKHKGWRGLWSLCRYLRSRQYDLVINPGASDRATILTWLSGGARRIGRLNRNQSRWLWSLLHDEVIDYPWNTEPMWQQKRNAFSTLLNEEGRLSIGFDLAVEDVDVTQLSLPPRYVHISPCASESIRNLPPATVVDFIERLHSKDPQLAFVLSGGPSASEKSRLRLIANALSFEVRVFAGELSLPQLSRIIAGAGLHVGPDSGPLHLARALNTPAIGCFLWKDASAEWMPVGAGYRCFGVDQRLLGGLYGLPVSEMVESATALCKVTSQTH